jgi:hypothetical protein
MPTRAKSNIAKPSPVADCLNPEMMMFGGALIRVTRPPRTEALASKTRVVGQAIAGTSKTALIHRP